MLKTAEELKEQAKKIGLKFYPVHKCSMCGYQCGYVISDNFERVEYDNGCDCVNYTIIQPRSWEDLASTYNMNQYLEELNNVWKFEK